MLHNVVAISALNNAEEACKEHTNFTPEKLKERGLVAIKVSDISFDYSDMSCQPRTESVDHKSVSTYHHQAVNGFEGNYGIRTPIMVTKNPLKGKELFKGLGGHHRYLVAIKAGYAYLICKVIDGFFDMSEESQMDIMMNDNAHGDNGMPSDRKSLLQALSRTLSSKTYMSRSRNLIKEYQSLLDEAGAHLSKEQEDVILSQMDPIKEEIKSDLRKRINRWSASTLSSSNVSTIATRAYNNWNNSENTKMYVPDKKDADTLLVKHMKEYKLSKPGKSILSKRFGQTIGNNAVDDRQIFGEVGKMIKDHYEKNGEDPDEFILAVHLSGASSNRDLLSMRKKFATQTTDYVTFIRPNLKNKFKVLFFGQIKTKDMYEDEKVLYSLEDILEKLEKLN